LQDQGASISRFASPKEHVLAPDNEVPCEHITSLYEA